MRGLVISGQFGNICVRQKNSEYFELGELLITEDKENKILLQVFDLAYGSQLSQQQLELVSGLKLEEDTDLQIMDEKLRSYQLANVKNILFIKGNKAAACKTLPKIFSPVRSITKQDVSFLQPSINPFFLGFLRSGKKTIPVEIILDGRNVLSHHVLISGTTGRGKSVLMKHLMWNLLAQNYAGILILDPHDEYYGRSSIGLKDHAFSSKLIYYTFANPPPGSRTLRINISLIKPKHFQGVIEWSDPQYQALQSYYREYADSWIEAIILNKPISVSFGESTLAVIKRQLLSLLNLSIQDGFIISKGIFSTTSGHSFVSDVIRALYESTIVVIDTSLASERIEVFLGSIIAHELLASAKKADQATLSALPVISIVLEEAPRVLSKDALERGNNVFSTIAREGRKFNIGLIAITQLPSLIPRDILANLNTKIILGTELKQERQAIIESAAQDLSKDEHAISSLDKGEAILTSTFARFAIPISIPFFDDVAKQQKSIKEQSTFSGMKLL
ncbi:ATP-binding protein [Candidatus Woesearchaeota archaeon]|nr:ATP-binding protein [Candidatus Woesearchaeota archaeon]